MTGLDKIINQILLEAEQAAKEKTNEARANAEQIIAEAEQDAKNIDKEMRKKIENDYAQALARGKSAAATQKKRELLAVKRQIIDKLIAQALNEVCSLPDDEYYKLVLSLARKYSDGSQKGEIAFSEKDFKRLPSDFSEKLEQATNGNLSISREFRENSGGFVLIYGGIEENCSFKAMFDSSAEELTDIIREMLFA